jgi:hypothetical protein
MEGVKMWWRSVDNEGSPSRRQSGENYIYKMEHDEEVIMHVCKLILDVVGTPIWGL